MDIGGRTIDPLCIEWYETNRRILHKRSTYGKDLTLKFFNGSQYLTEGDVVYMDEFTAVVIELVVCSAIIIRPQTMEQMAAVCYEIGNKHLPLFFDGNELTTPYDAPLLRLLMAAGYNVAQGDRKLINPLRSTVVPHGHQDNGSSLFSRILKLTTPDE